MKGRYFLALLPAVLFYVSSCQKGTGKVELKTEHDSASYLFGHQIGTQFANSPMTDLNIEAFINGMQDALDDKELFMDPGAVMTFLNGYMQKTEDAASEIYKIESEKFLADNMLRKGVNVTESGLQYEILVEGNGPKPTDTSTVTVHYHGTLIDGTVFDSSVERGEPATFAVNQVIPGWTEVLQLMPTGSKWKVYIPSDLAYGTNPRPGGVIKPNMALIFEIELISVN
jgi:FKBP-type peptidyl-prolyl cis-trans isomerase FklB